MNAIEIAHYGRWFPYNNYKYPFWWFDQKYKRAVHIDTLCGIMGYKSADEINIDECRMAGYVPWFCLDIPALERKYASIYFPRQESKRLLEMDDRAMDFDFGRVIEELGLNKHWYEYELKALLSAAEAWCQENRINIIN